MRAAAEGLGVPYEVMPCDPALADTAAFCEHYGIPPSHSANTIIVSSKKEPRQSVACLVLSTTKLDVNHTVSDLMQVRLLSFASAEETIALTGMMVGGVTVLALPDSIPLYIDAAVMKPDYVIIGGGSRSMKIRMAPEHLRRIPNAKVIEGLAVLRELKIEN
ncbi:MAG TPA: YbaK/EbsC family protein [Thermoanaerobaculia bacterium]|nr:YbaK/EbsC family protein [Thermoanaerobaculia bacterium]